MDKWEQILQKGMSIIRLLYKPKYSFSYRALFSLLCVALSDLSRNYLYIAAFTLAPVSRLYIPHGYSTLILEEQSYHHYNMPWLQVLSGISHQHLKSFLLFNWQILV